jgi:hypothetical protein
MNHEKVWTPSRTSKLMEDVLPPLLDKLSVAAK